MTVWDSVRSVLLRLLDEQPRALTRYPDPRVDEGRVPPFRIGLAPWASDAAAELHDRFGADVELTVGALAYPSGTDRHGARRDDDAAPVVDANRIGIEPVRPLVVRSGYTERPDLLFTNHTDADVGISTNGQLTAVVLDPATGRVVGGFSGAQHLPLVVFRIPPGDTRPIPVLIGTAGFDRTFGYAVPPGDWVVRAPLVVNGDRLSTPTLPLTVIA